MTKSKPAYRNVFTTTPTVNVDWLNRMLPDPEAQREYARERVMLVVTETIAGLMKEADLRRSDVAQRLGKSRGHISQVLSGQRNMTLHTLGDVLWACQRELEEIRTIPLGQAACTTERAREWHWHNEASSLFEIVAQLSAPATVATPKATWSGGNQEVVPWFTAEYSVPDHDTTNPAVPEERAA